MSKLIAVLLVTCSIVACSSQSPLTPGGFPAAGDGLSAKGSPAAPGIYTLSFHANLGGTWQEVASLTVLSEELVLKAVVTDSSGTPAPPGGVTFEYCSYSKRPPNDISRADEAPKEACEQGTATWARLRSISIADGNCGSLATGATCLNFGVVRLPRTVGFRFRFASQKSGIASGTSEARNFTWVAP